MISIFISLVLILVLVAAVHDAAAATLPFEPLVDLKVLGSGSIAVNISAPESDGGSPINSYKVEWDDDPGTYEVQTITTSTDVGTNEIQSITLQSFQEFQSLTCTSTRVLEEQTITVSDATSGYFYIELDNSAFPGGSLQYSGFIYVGAPGNGGSFGLSVQDIINSMSNIQPFGSVSVNKITSATDDSVQYVVTFPESMGDLPLMKVHGGMLKPEGVAKVGVETTVIGNVISGSFSLVLNGRETEALRFDASADDVRVALEKIASIGSVLYVSRSALDFQYASNYMIVINAPTDDGGPYTPLAD